MSKSQKVTAPLDSDSLADLDRLAAHMECTREQLVAAAVDRFIAEESRFLPPHPDDPLANLPPYVETDPLAIALNEAERKAAEAMAAFLKAGEDAIARGDVISHDDLMAELKALDEQARARKDAA